VSEHLIRHRPRYRALLEEYLRSDRESGLLQAYEFGREMMTLSIGVLDLAAIHHDVLMELSATSGSAEWMNTRKVGDFFSESLSPFEMTHRGYRDANRRLQELNDSLREANEKAESINRELEAFSYSVAHDLRAPLRSIEGFGQLLDEEAERGSWPAKVREHLGRIRAACRRMAQMIDALLGLSRVHRSELQIGPVDMSAMASSIVAELRAGEPGRRANVMLANGLKAEGDENLLRIALENLFSNAWKYTKKRNQAEIEFGCRSQDARTLYFIRDNGAGFDMKYADKLFGAFQRLHAEHEFPGTGIGLATVRRIIHRHGGKIWAESEEGKGTTFYFFLSR